MRLPRCLCVYESPLNNFWMPEPIVMKLGIYIMAPEPISTTDFINPSHQTVMGGPLSLLGNGSVNTFPLQRIHATETLLTVLFSVRSVSYQRNVGD
jgi:hypothetical protein